jgi:signal peptidase I
LRRPGLLREGLSTALFLLAVFTLLQMALPRSVVLSISMEPNLVEQDRLLINRVNYLFDQPGRGDVVVLEPPHQPKDEPAYIKRLIGLPGETIELRATHVFINGVQLDEPYLPEPCNPARCPDAIWHLGPDDYFFMGDNRNHSYDSRAFGPIKRDHIVGQALLRWWPPTKWGMLAYRYPGE